MNCHRCGGEHATSRTAICVCHGEWLSRSRETTVLVDENLLAWTIGLCNRCLLDQARSERSEASDELLGFMVFAPLVGIAIWFVELGSNLRGFEKLAFGAALILPPIVGPVLAISYLRRRVRWKEIMQAAPSQEEIARAFASEAKRIFDEVQGKKRSDFPLPKPDSLENYSQPVKDRLAYFSRTGEQFTVHTSEDNFASLHSALSKRCADQLSMLMSGGTAP